MIGQDFLFRKSSARATNFSALDKEYTTVSHKLSSLENGSPENINIKSYHIVGENTAVQRCIQKYYFVIKHKTSNYLLDDDLGVYSYNYIMCLFHSESSDVISQKIDM